MACSRHLDTVAAVPEDDLSAAFSAACLGQSCQNKAFERLSPF